MEEELIDIAECLCDGYRSMPCGCEGGARYGSQKSMQKMKKITSAIF